MTFYHEIVTGPMLKTIQDYFQNQFAVTDSTHTEHQLQLATAALLIEMTRADHRRDEAEMLAVQRTLKRVFSIDDTSLNKLLELAEAEAADMTSYYEFSSLIKNGFEYQERVKVIEMLWEVAYADDTIDKYEEHMIRKIAGLLYIKREDIVASKYRAIEHHQQAGQ